MNAKEALMRGTMEAVLDTVNSIGMTGNGRVSLAVNLIEPLTTEAGEAAEDFKATLDALAAEGHERGRLALLRTIAFLKFFDECIMTERCICGEPDCPNNPKNKGSDSTPRTH